MDEKTMFPSGGDPMKKLETEKIEKVKEKTAFETVAFEVAEADVKRFIDKLKINPIKLESLEDERNTLIRLVEDGHLIIDDDGIATFKPYDEFKYDEQVVEKMKFKGRRITVNEFEKHKKGRDDEAKTRSMFSYLIGKPSAFLTRLSGDDYVFVASISAFFLPR